MSHTQPELELDARPRCAHCGDVIGVYEPLVLTERAGHRRTSRAAEPHLIPAADPWYHGLCFALREGGPEPIAVEALEPASVVATPRLQRSADGAGSPRDVAC